MLLGAPGLTTRKKKTVRALASLLGTRSYYYYYYYFCYYYYYYYYYYYLSFPRNLGTKSLVNSKLLEGSLEFL